MLHTISELKKLSIRATDGKFGSIADLYFDDRNWAVLYLIADTAGWLSDRQVLISPAAVTGLDWDTGELAVRLTKTQVEHSPPVEADLPVTAQEILAMNAFYGWPDYWGGQPPHPVPVKPERVGDPHLRSAEFVKAYAIRALDGEIGHVDDYLVDDKEWFVRYLVVDTRKWLPGKKVLIAPPWIRDVDWADRAVAVELTRDSIRSAPGFDKSSSLTREQEVALHQYYRKTGYWMRLDL